MDLDNLGVIGTLAAINFSGILAVDDVCDVPVWLCVHVDIASS